MSNNKFKLDPILPLLIVSILTIGFLILFSAGYDENKSIKLFSWLPLEIHSTYFIKHFQNFLVALIPGLCAFFLGPKRIMKFAIPLYIISILLLVVVLVMGHSAGGAERWIALGPVKFQPSELVKVSAIIFFAWYLATFKDLTKLAGWKDLIAPVALVSIPLVLIFIQPNLGTCLSVLGIVFGMILLAGIQFKILVVLGLIGLVSTPIAWSFVLKPYHQNRILSMFNPEADPLGQGYQTIQSKIAIGSGELFGKGMLQGTQTQLQFLPEHTTDYVFSVLGEEWGFFGCSMILILYLALIFRVFTITNRTKDLFQTYLCFGFACYLTIHVFVNIGMVIGILPVVGIPLPLLSYGGSAMLTTMFLLGFIFRISYDAHRL